MLKYKKLLLLLIVFLTIPSYTFASPNWGAIGTQLGEIIAHNMNETRKERKDFINPQYDFSKVRKIFVAVSVPEDYRRYVIDPQIEELCFNYFFNTIKKDNDNNLVACDFSIMSDVMNLQYEQCKSDTTPDEFFNNFISQYFDTVLFINIYASMINQNNEAVALIDLTLRDSHTGEIIFQRTESRINRDIEAWREIGHLRPMTEILHDYIEKLNKEIKKSSKNK